MDDRVSSFRTEVRRLGGSGRGRRYPAALRQLAVSYWVDAESAGESLSSTATKLGVSEITLARWSELNSELESGGELREVVLSAGESPRLALMTPGGYRVEGLDVATTADLLRLLA